MKKRFLFIKAVCRFLLNDSVWCVVGTIAGVLLAFVFYFSGCVDKATFWMVCSLMCIMNLKG